MFCKKPNTLPMKKVAKVLLFGFLAFACVSPKLYGQPETAKNSEIDTELKDYIPAIHDELVAERLKCIENEIPLTYNNAVKKQIERFCVKQRKQIKYYLMRKDRYFPIFEEILAKYNMPDELKYLSVVESALIPKATSWASAVGLWQFMPFTGKMYGLKQDFYIDERIDPYKSTEAAARFIKYLYERFGDWHLALAAYNAGPGRIDQAIKRAGGKRNFWDIYPYIPAETRAYVPTFIAVTYVFNYHHEHFAELPEEVHTYIPADTIIVSQFVNVKELAKQLDIDFEVLQVLNPQLKKNVVPRHYKDYALRIPKDKIEYFKEHREDILKAASKGSYQYIPYPAAYNEVLANTKGKKKITHTVRKGETLAQIAQVYQVHTRDVMLWNKLRSQNLIASQRLVLWVEEKAKEKENPENSEENLTQNNKQIENSEKEPQNSQEVMVPVHKVALKTPSLGAIAGATSKNNLPTNKAMYHVVKQGDTLWSISKRYNGSVEQIRKLNPNLKGESLAIGQKIRVY
jgi:membrane-bound lytic murein transglycosylase D